MNLHSPVSSVTCPVTNGAQGRFSPDQIPGLALWLDPSDLSTVLKSSPGLVSQWTNKAGGHAFAMESDLYKPSWMDNQVNGRPVVRFDGTRRLIHTGTLTTAVSGSLIIVHRVTAPLPAANTMLLSSADTATTTYFIGFNGVLSSTIPNLNVWQTNNDTADKVRGSTNLVAAVPYVMSWSSDGAAYILRVNMVDQALTVVGGANTGDWFGDTPNRDNVVLGGLVRTSFTQGLIGDIAYVLLYDRALSRHEMETVENHLAWIFGV